MAVPPVLIKTSMIHPLSLTYERLEDVWLASLSWNPLNAPPVHHSWNILIKLCEHILIKGVISFMFLRHGYRRLQVFRLYVHSMHKTFEQLIITRCFAVILWLLHLYCMFNACGSRTMSEFSISLCCQIIAKWLSYFLSVTVGLFFH